MVTITLDEQDDDDFEWDLEQAFDAMDDNKIRRLSIDQAYTVILGLGYLKDYRDKDRFTPDVLRVAVRNIRRKQQEQEWEEDLNIDDGRDWVTLDVLQQILASHSDVLHRDYSTPVFAHSILELDQGSKGYIDASDIQALASSVGEPISQEEARAMIVVTREQVAADGDEIRNTKVGDTVLEFDDLKELLAPPEGEEYEKL